MANSPKREPQHDVKTLFRFEATKPLAGRSKVAAQSVATWNELPSLNSGLTTQSEQSGIAGGWYAMKSTGMRLSAFWQKIAT